MRGVRVAAALSVVVACLGAPRGEAGPGDAAWTTSYPAPNIGMALGGLDAFPDGTVVALYREQGKGTVLLRSRDFGATWSPVPQPPSARGYVLDGLAMATPRVGYAVGVPPARSADTAPTAYDGGLLVTNDGMASWREFRLVRDPAAAGYALDVVRASPSGRSALLTGRTYDRHHRLMPGSDVIWVADGGRTQRRTRLGQTTWGWAEATMLDDRTAAVFVAEWYASGERWLPGTPCCAEYKTSVHVTRDAGRTWTRTLLLDDEVGSADWVAPDWLAASSARHGSVYVSRDGGRRFGRVGAVRMLPPGASDDGTHPPAVQVDYVDKRVAYANACQAGMWRTTNGGETWEMEPSPNHGDVFTAPFCSYNGIAASDAQRAVSVYPGGLLTRVTGTRRTSTGPLAP